MASLIVVLFNKKCFLFVYIYIDLFKLKAYKPFENSVADLSWLLFSSPEHNVLKGGPSDLGMKILLKYKKKKKTSLYSKKTFDFHS